MKLELDSEKSMKSYIGNQSDLIRPVSVKLENCMLMSDKKGLMEGMLCKTPITFDCNGDDPTST